MRISLLLRRRRILRGSLSTAILVLLLLIITLMRYHLLLTEYTRLPKVRLLLRDSLRNLFLMRLLERSILDGILLHRRSSLSQMLRLFCRASPLT